jgi:hypothetical protein
MLNSTAHAQAAEVAAPGLDSEVDDWELALFALEPAMGDTPLVRGNGEPGPFEFELRKVRRKWRRRLLLRRAITSRALAWALTFLALAGAAVATSMSRDLSLRVGSLTSQVATSRSVASESNGNAAALSAELGQSQAQAAGLQATISKLRATLSRNRIPKARTIVRREIVTRTISKWVPSGKGVTVDTTGFSTQIEIHDVQLTRALGFTDLVGIAINRSDQAISYAELGCTFVDGSGQVLANAIDNRDNWAPNAAWGFDCGAQVKAAGGTLRVNQMS